MLPRLTGLAILLAFTPFVAAEEPKAVFQAGGLIAPASRVHVSATATGIVSRVLADVGDKVRKGQVLAELDDAPVKSDLRLAVAKLKLTEAQLDAAKSAAAIEKERAEINLRRAQQQLERVRKLRDTVSADEVEGAEQAVRAAELVRKAADDGTKLAIVIAEREVARAELERVERQLTDTRLLAPTDGIVIRRDVSVGQIVRPGDIALEVADVSKLFAVVEVPERHLAKLAAGQPCRLSVAAGDETVMGVLAAISPVIDPAKNTGTVRVAFTPVKGPARVGGFVTVSFLKAEK